LFFHPEPNFFLPRSPPFFTVSLSVLKFGTPLLFFGTPPFLSSSLFFGDRKISFFSLPVCLFSFLLLAVETMFYPSQTSATLPSILGFLLSGQNWTDSPFLFFLSSDLPSFSLQVLLGTRALFPLIIIFCAFFFSSFRSYGGVIPHFKLCMYTSSLLDFSNAFITPLDLTCST